MTLCIKTHCHQSKSLWNNKSISEDIINPQSGSSAPQQPGQHSSLFVCQREGTTTPTALLITSRRPHKCPPGAPWQPNRGSILNLAGNETL